MCIRDRILGDLHTGLAMGAVGELAFMGFGVSQGGSVPPNPMGPDVYKRQKYYTQAIGKPIYQKQQIQLYGISQSKKEIRMVNKSKPVRGGQGDCSQIKD